MLQASHSELPFWNARGAWRSGWVWFGWTAAAPRWLNPSISHQAKGYNLPDFYSGASEQSGRLSEGLLLRR